MGCGDPDQDEAEFPAAARVTVTPEPPGENCAAGGQRLDVGVDHDGDGTLSPTEVGETSYICNGEHGADGRGGEDGRDGADGKDGEDGRDGADGKDGEDGRIPRLVVTPEPPGPNCAAGGQRIDVGFDDDQDGALTGDEIDESLFVCNGEDGTDGQDGMDGQGCTAETDLSVPELSLSCPDGSKFTWRIGMTPPVVASLYDHTCGVRMDGRIACWGLDDHGQASPPREPDFLAGGWFRAVAPGWEHTCAIRADHTVACWGNNSAGEATPPSGQFKEITSGERYTCGLRMDGTIACWGLNYFGSSTPGTFQSISGNRNYFCGIRTDDTIACWGVYGTGVTAAPSGTFKLVSTGRDHACAIDMDDDIHCGASSRSSIVRGPRDLSVS